MQSQTQLEGIVLEIRRSFDDFIVKRSTVFPTILDRMRKGGQRQARLLWPFQYFSINNFRVRNKRYILFDSRHAELSEQFTRGEAAIVGGPKECRLAVRQGIAFCFSGDLYACTREIFFERTIGDPAQNVLRVIARWIRFFNQQQRPCYLVMPNDTLPIALMLAKVAHHCPHVRVVCVQHGLFNDGYEYDDIDGRNSHINLVYSDMQRAEMLRRLPGALVEVFGFPTQRESAVVSSAKPSRVVLVGTGALENPAVYRRSLEIFKLTESAMMEDGRSIEYRPHPTERSEHYGSACFTVNIDAKCDLIKGSCKVFIGFTSTLLYEAKLAGHVVIILNDPQVPGYSIEPLGPCVNSNEMPELVAIVTREWNRIRDRKKDTEVGLRQRFDSALQRAESALHAKLNTHTSSAESDMDEAKTTSKNDR